MLFDTICAISSPIGEGAISMIRVSGEQAITIVNKLFQSKSLLNVETHTTHYGNIVNFKNNKFIDEVMVNVLREPRTFTKENIVEINCHGGILVTSKILELLVENGARLAEPGEFTKRAFLNGRIDLTQAEAIMDVITAKTENALSVAGQGLSGNVSKLINNLKTKLLEIMGNIEVNIDYPEYDDVDVLTNEVLKPKLFHLLQHVDDILEKSQTGLIMKEGIKTAIVGRPNVGKSSILNSLLDEEKAIVTEIAGTTRDLVEGALSVNGLQLNLIDTAGIRETDDKVEKIGIDRSFKAIEEADLVIMVMDYSEKISRDDKVLLNHIKHKNHIIAVNKIDLPKDKNHIVRKDQVMISVKDGIGIEKLKSSIVEKAGVSGYRQNLTYLSNLRQIQKLKEARYSLKEGLISIDNQMPVDIISIDLSNAYMCLNEILGVQSTDELIDQLFSRFCLGK